MLREAACPGQGPAQPGEGAEELGGVLPLPAQLWACSASVPVMLSCSLKMEGKGFTQLETPWAFSEKRFYFMCVIQKITNVIEIWLVNISYECNYLVSLVLHSAFLYNGMKI